MSDLYTRLEEIQGMNRVLSDDAHRLSTQLGDRSIQPDEQAGLRRAYVRALFALIEAIVEQHKRLVFAYSGESGHPFRSIRPPMKA